MIYIILAPFLLYFSTILGLYIQIVNIPKISHLKHMIWLAPFLFIFVLISIIASKEVKFDIHYLDFNTFSIVMLYVFAEIIYKKETDRSFVYVIKKTRNQTIEDYKLAGAFN